MFFILIPTDLAGLYFGLYFDGIAMSDRRGIKHTFIIYSILQMMAVMLIMISTYYEKKSIIFMFVIFMIISIYLNRIMADKCIVMMQKLD